MSEFAAFNTLKNLPLSVIKNPAGTFSFVGNGPVELFYIGSPDAIALGLRHGMGFVRHLGVKVRTYQTVEDAIAAAKTFNITAGF